MYARRRKDCAPEDRRPCEEKQDEGKKEKWKVRWKRCDRCGEDGDAVTPEVSPPRNTRNISLPARTHYLSFNESVVNVNYYFLY
ncbi:hypothetical protein PUN28_017413 [Cardiocondyla obscurior]|uniref:Uncharacterized protein n=1 Tax=Cardiocondyla obscurior TaxID=286306 RepID=A0AAW2ELM1_9HYME